MKLIVGLGNPGQEYAQTRHNLGFMIVEQFLKDAETVRDTVWSHEEKLKSDTAMLDWQRRSASSGQAKGDIVERVILIKPQTFMNNSGMAVQLVSAFYKIDPQDIWIVHDELDLPLGKMKIRLGGAGAGHHGVEDIMEKIGTDKFWRYRMGIGESRITSGRSVSEDGTAQQKVAKRNMGNTNDFVLGEFSSKEMGDVKKLVKTGSEAIQVALEKGIETAMNRFNTK